MGGFTSHPCSLGSQPADLRHSPHSCLSDTGGEVIITKATHRVSDITGEKKLRPVSTNCTKRLRKETGNTDCDKATEVKIGD